MDDPELNKLVEKLEKYKALCYAYGGIFLKSYASLWAVGLQFAIMAYIYFYIYQVAGLEVCGILLAVGIISTNIRDRAKMKIEALEWAKKLKQ